GLDAIEAERAVEVADLGGHEQSKLAAALHDTPTQRRVAGRRLPSAHAVSRPTRPAGVRIAHAQLEGRDRRGDEVELPDGAGVLAERSSEERRVGRAR